MFVKYITGTSAGLVLLDSQGFCRGWCCFICALCGVVLFAGSQYKPTSWRRVQFCEWGVSSIEAGRAFLDGEHCIEMHIKSAL